MLPIGDVTRHSWQFYLFYTTISSWRALAGASRRPSFTNNFATVLLDPPTWTVSEEPTSYISQERQRTFRAVYCTWSQLSTTLRKSLSYVALRSRGSLKATEVKHSVAADEMSQHRLRVGQRSGIIWCTPLISGKLTLVHKRLWS